MNSLRSFTSYITIPPIIKQRRYFNESMTREALWTELRGLQVNRDSLKLFNGNLKERRAAWDLFRNFIRQAELNDQAAQHMHGSGSALLHYYCAMNLAKAALVLHRPKLIVPPAKIHHGLSFQATGASSLKSAKLRVNGGGIFPALYEVVTSQPIKAPIDIPMIRVLRAIPEIGTELVQTGHGRSIVESLFCTVLMNQANATSFAVLALTDHSGVLRQRSHPAVAQLLKHYEPIEVPSEHWRRLFSFSPRAMFGDYLRYYQSRSVDHIDDAGQVPVKAWHQLSPYLDASPDQTTDAFFCPGLYASRRLPMTPVLARYAAIFYLSSLVRYRPDLLDPFKHGADAWLFDSVAQASPMLLTNGLLGHIDGQENLFNWRDLRA